jgi:hypothetical protein
MNIIIYFVVDNKNSIVMIDKKEFTWTKTIDCIIQIQITHKDLLSFES